MRGPWRARRSMVTVGAVCALATALTVAVVARGSGPARPTEASLVARALAAISTTTATRDHATAAVGSAAPSCSFASLGLTEPQAQFPNGSHPLGVPFVASLTAGEILSGFHEGWEAAKHPAFPWGLSLTGISGYVTGLLEIPSLQTVVQPTTGIGFCDDSYIAKEYPKTTLLPTPPPVPRVQFTLINDNKPNDNTQNYDTKLDGYAPYFFSLDAVGAPTLAVTGVTAGGALELSGTTTAATSVNLYFVAKSKPVVRYQLAQTCEQYANTTIGVSTTASAEPASGPPGGSLQFGPAPVAGALPALGSPGATATLVANDFTVPAFKFTGTGGCSFALALNGALSGFGKTGAANCAITCPNNIASPPGWSQLTVKATITQIGLPYGVPAGFGF